jgi:hypothetical protein
MTTLDAIRGRFERDPGSLTLADIRDLLAIADAAAALLAEYGESPYVDLAALRAALEGGQR